MTGISTSVSISSVCISIINSLVIFSTSKTVGTQTRQRISEHLDAVVLRMFICCIRIGISTTIGIGPCITLHISFGSRL